MGNSPHDKALAAEVAALPYNNPPVTAAKFKILYGASVMVGLDFWFVVEEHLGFDGVKKLISVLREAAQRRKAA